MLCRFVRSLRGCVLGLHLFGLLGLLLRLLRLRLLGLRCACFKAVPGVPPTTRVCSTSPLLLEALEPLNVVHPLGYLDSSDDGNLQYGCNPWTQVPRSYAHVKRAQKCPENCLMLLHPSNMLLPCSRSILTWPWPWLWLSAEPLPWRSHNPAGSLPRHKKQIQVLNRQRYFFCFGSI